MFPFRDAPLKSGFGFTLARWPVLFVVGAVIAGHTFTLARAAAKAGEDEFASLVQLAPFVVSGKSLAISIHARTRSDRHYGEQFAEGVVKVVHEAVTDSTGKGLVIIGAKGEPHPALVFRKFLALAKDGKLDPAIAARGPELAAMMERWQRSLNEEKAADDDPDGEDLDLDFERIFLALPLPLEGVGAKLYQLAWDEKFDEGRVEAKLRALRAEDLERRDRFKSFEWVFYLPPKGALDRVIDDLIAAALKKEEMGLLARTAAKGVLLVLKPKIRRAIEAMRQGMMFTTVVQAQTQYGEEEVSALADAYVEVLMPFSDADKKTPGRTEHERAVNAVRDRLRKYSAAMPLADTAASEPVTPAPAN